MTDQYSRQELFSAMVPCIKIFSGQRPLNMDRVKELANALYQNYRQFGSLRLRHPFYLGYLPGLERSLLPSLPSGNYYLLDGQHRFEALRQLILNKYIPDQLLNFSIIGCRDETQLRTEFINLNNVTPMLICYTQPNDVVELAVKRFSTLFTNIKEGAGKRQRPNISLDVIKSAMIAGRIVEQFKIQEYEKLYEALCHLQNWYSNWSWENFVTVLVCKPTDETVMKVWTRIKAEKLSYLGMFTGAQCHIWVSHLNHVLDKYIAPTPTFTGPTSSVHPDM